LAKGIQSVLKSRGKIQGRGPRRCPGEKKKKKMRSPLEGKGGREIRRGGREYGVNGKKTGKRTVARDVN